jgi:hypothetical protein
MDDDKELSEQEDRESADSFPASDPPSYSGSTPAPSKPSQAEGERDPSSEPDSDASLSKPSQAEGERNSGGSSVASARGSMEGGEGH